MELHKNSTLEQLQLGMLKIYGKYDLEKSLIWMAEEFGEVVAAIHKKSLWMM